MTDPVTADWVAALLSDDPVVKAFVEAGAELFINGTTDRPPCGILPFVIANSDTNPETENNPEFDTRYLGRWQIGVDLGGDNND